MEKIKITEDRNEMISIGKELFKQKQSLYTEHMCSLVYKKIDENLEAVPKDLTRDQIFYLSIYDYWVYGCRIDEWFFYSYFDLSHTEKLEYITTRVKGVFLNHLNNPEDRHLLDNKYETYQLMPKYFKRDIIQVTDENDYNRFLEFTNNHKSFVVKPVDSTYGRGIYKTTLTEDTDVRKFFIDLLNGGGYQADRLCGLNSYVIEEAIEEIPEVAKMHPESLQCLRCITFLVDGKPEIFPYFYYKIGTGTQTIVNGTSGSIIAGVDSTKGVICTNGFIEKLGAPEYEKHPDSGVRFIGFKFPAWDELIAMLKEMAILLPRVRYVSWDACYTEKGWCIIEANYAGEFRGMQIPFKKGLRKDLESIIKWKPEKDYWWE